MARHKVDDLVGGDDELASALQRSSRSTLEAVAPTHEGDRAALQVRATEDSAANRARRWRAMHIAAPVRLYRGFMLRSALMFVFASVVACVPEAPPAPAEPSVSGAGLLINVAPSNRPGLVGNFDFELLGAGSGKACVDRNSATRYWLRMEDVTLPTDGLTKQAVAAAMADAISRLDDVDTILLTRVVTESKGSDRVCATITGRGVRLIKAGPTSGPSPRADADAHVGSG